MDILITHQVRYCIAPDGSCWAGNSAASYETISRYLEVFDRVILFARARPVDAPPQGWERTDGEGVVPFCIPDISDPISWALKYRSLCKMATSALSKVDAVELRVPCFVGNLVRNCLQKNQPYGVHVVGDPGLAFAPGSTSHVGRPFYRWWLTKQLREVTRDASVAIYVTENYLQGLYPPSPLAMSVGVSDVRLPPEAFVQSPRRVNDLPAVPKLLLVGSLATRFKGGEPLLRALQIVLNRHGIPFHLTFVGDGAIRPDLEVLSKELGLQDRVTFRGQLPNPESVQKELRDADIFVMPSLHEGLPRALVEAMACALPCISSTVAGIPELLPQEDLVPPGDVNALAAILVEVLKDSDRLSRMSERNLARANDFQQDLLKKKQRDSYIYLRERTREWLQKTS